MHLAPLDDPRVSQELGPLSVEDDADMAKMVAREVGCSRGQAFLASAAEASGCSRPGPPLHTCSGPQRLAKPSAGRVAAVRV